LAKYLEVPGATTTMPVSSAKSPFPLDFAKDARKKFEQFHYQLGGDHALYYNLHLSEVLHTAMSKPNANYRPLEKALSPDLGDKVSFKTKEGELTLNQYVVHPNHRVQAVVLVHKGHPRSHGFGKHRRDHERWKDLQEQAVNSCPRVLLRSRSSNP
jgi:hypothetical protein